MKFLRLFAAAVILVTACTSKTKAPGVMQTETIGFADSSRAFTCLIDMEFPVVQDEVSAKVCKTLNDSMKAHLEEMGYLEEPATFKSLDCSAIFNFYDSVANQDYNERKQYYEEAPGWEFDINLTKIEESDRYIVFYSEDHVYYGGAHGGTIGLGAMTFDKETGSLVSEMIDTSYIHEMQPILLEGLEAYFRESDYDFTGQDLKEILNLNDGLIPLPVTTPYPSGDNLVFTYQEYEIAWYAAGAPEFKVPISTLEEYLTEDAKKIL